jgi:hypothetical protein
MWFGTIFAQSLGQGGGSNAFARCYERGGVSTLGTGGRAIAVDTLAVVAGPLPDRAGFRRLCRLGCQNPRPLGRSDLSTDKRLFTAPGPVWHQSDCHALGGFPRHSAPSPICDRVAKAIADAELGLRACAWP